MSTDYEIRKFALEWSLQLARKSTDLHTVETQDMIDAAALVEEYLKTGKHCRTLEASALQCAMEEAEQMTPHVARPKARAVMKAIAARLPVRLDQWLD